MMTFKDRRRRLKQQALQTFGVVEATEDSEFQREYEAFKKTCVAIKSLSKSMAVHLEAIRTMQTTGAALSVELAAFHQHTKASTATVAFGQAHAEMERVQLASVERLYEEEVSAASELPLWQLAEVEERIRVRKKQLLDYDAHLRKYESLTKVVSENEDREAASDGGSKKPKKKGVLAFGRARTESELAEDLAQRKLKLEQAEEGVDESTKWLLEHFEEMADKRMDGSVLEGPMSALLACELHLGKESTRKLELIKPLFKSTDIFASTLQGYDKEPSLQHAFDVEGVANITNLNSGARRRGRGGNNDAEPRVFGLPIQSSTPPVVCDAVAFIRAQGLDTEGVFRIPGSMEVVEAVRDKYEAGAVGVIADADVGMSVNDVCTLLKMWFRELPEPVIPAGQYTALMDVVRGDTDLEKTVTVPNVLHFASTLPDAHKELLGFVCGLLYDVTKNKDVNKMSAANLATCLAPSLMRAPEHMPANEVLKDMQAAIAAVKVFIEHAPRLAKPTDEAIRENTTKRLLDPGADQDDQDDEDDDDDPAQDSEDSG